uniref:PEGA domain-containing protein n=1 Tax=viral metagenome TaxID=1070528 RepID=A0A6C0JSV3_9ZZZZ
MNINYKSLLVLIISMLLMGCATVMNQHVAESLTIRSDPSQANVIIEDETGVKIYEGTTPTFVHLVKKKGYFSGKKYSVRIRKEGYEDKLVIVDTTINKWYIGNIVIGGVIGFLVIDPITGAMWSLSTNDVNVTFDEPKRPLLLNPDDIIIVTLQDIPLDLHHKLIPIVK